MYRTLLVPLDGSAYGERAVPMAVALARHLGGRLILVRTASAAVFPGVDATNAEVEAVREAESYLEKLASEINEPGLNIEFAVPYGDAAEEILLEIGLRNADLVVMCTHGRSGLGRWIYGSVASQVLAHSPAPVLLVRPTGGITRFEREPARAQLLVPLDGSAFAETALPHAIALARTCSGKVVLLRIIDQHASAYAFAEASFVPLSGEGERQEAEAYLEGVGQSLRDEGLEVLTVVREGWPADVIAYSGEELGSSVIVMATHGRTSVARLILGNVALEVVRRSPLPVMLIRPGQVLAKDD